MKKILFGLAFVAGISVMGMAQTTPKKVENGDSKTKVKPNTTTRDKAHNILHPHHPQSHGVKAKHKNGEAKVKAEAKTPNS